MEVRLNEFLLSRVICSILRFNPCFNGSETKSFNLFNVFFMEAGFNPCFNGSETKSSVCASYGNITGKFQSLF